MEVTKREVMKMGSLKAPEPDGFQLVFFKETWELTGQPLHSFAHGIIEGGNIPAEATEALLVLIPKEEQPTSIRSVRPRSLLQRGGEGDLKANSGQAQRNPRSNYLSKSGIFRPRETELR